MTAPAPPLRRRPHRFAPTLATTLLAGLCLGLAAGAARAQPPTPPADATSTAQEMGERGRRAERDVWIVGTKLAPPFAMRDETGRWRGIGIELWDAVAGKLGIDYELRETDLAGLLDGLESGELDASVAAITVTPERERRVDFSHPFYASGLGIAVPTSGELGWTGLLATFVQPGFLKVVGVLALVLFAAGLALWFFERRANREQFPPGWRGVLDSFWWSAVTMTTVGYGDKAPVSWGGRLVAVVWMFTSVVVISSFTGALASSFTIAGLASRVESLDDLPGARVISVTGSTSEQYLEANRLRYRAAERLEDAFHDLEAGEAEALVYDKPILQYLAAGRALRVLPETFERQSYAIALPEGTERMEEEIDVALLEVLADPAWENVLATYLGEGG